MNTNLLRTSLLISCALLLLAACSSAKLEARLEANPQCKDVVNPKTGALMPCPGSDKAFYREIGLAPAKPVPEVSNPIASSPATTTTAPSVQTPLNKVAPSAPMASTQTAPAQTDCKPQIHKKTGGTLPCPAPD